jgi:hypothetical protein
MPKRRPAAVTTIAIINIIFGGLAILCGGCGAIFQLGLGVAANAPAAGGGPNPLAQLAQFIKRELPGYQAVETTHAVGLMLLGTLCIVGAIGLLLMQGWGRWVTVAYAALIVFLQLGYIVYETAFVLPAMQRFQAAQAHSGVAPPGSEGQVVGGVLGAAFAVLITLAQAVTSLIIVLLPSVGTAFAGRPTRRRRRDYDEEDEDDYDDRPRRRRRPRDDDYDE